jgi:hypothetical protein
MTTRMVTVVLLSSTLGACTPVIHGPPATLHTIAAPDPVTPEVQVTVVTLPTPAGPTPGQGQWRAWMPTQVQPNGDITEGHWMTLSLDAPTLTVITPVHPMPRAPKPVLTPKQPVLKRSMAQTPPMMSPQGTPDLALPQGGQ